MENEEDVLNMHSKGFYVNNIGGRKVTASFPPPFLESFKKKLLVPCSLRSSKGHTVLHSRLDGCTGARKNVPTSHSIFPARSNGGVFSRGVKKMEILTKVLRSNLKRFMRRPRL